MTYEEKVEIAERVRELGLTLLGKPARVCRLRAEYPVVCSGCDVEIEYSWKSIINHIATRTNF